MTQKSDPTILVGSLFIMEGFAIKAGYYRQALNKHAILKISVPF
jgi:hypothetical protein